MFYRVALFGIVFVFIFGWKIGEPVDMILWTSAAALAWGLWKHGTGWVFRNPAAVCVFVLLCWSAVVTAAFVSEDLFYLGRGVRSLVNFLGAGALALLVLDRYRDGAKALATGASVVVAAVAAHAALVLLMFVMPPLRETIYGITDAAKYVNDTSSFAGGFRIPGLTYGLATTSVVHAFGALAAFARLLDSRPASLAWLWYAFAFTLITISIFVIGRSGLVAVAGGVGLLLARFVLAERAGRVLAGLFPFLALGVGVFVALLAIGLGGGGSAEDDSFVGKFNYYTLTHVFELVDLVTGGDSETVDMLSTMFFVPDSPLTLLAGGMGSGRGGRFYLASDSGYIRLIYGIGVVGVILSVSAYVAFAVAGLRSRLPGGLPLLLAYFGVVVIVFNVKELAVLTRNQLSLVAFLYWLVWLPANAPRRAATTRADAARPGMQPLPGAA